MPKVDERAEVDQLGTAVGGQPHVARADVAMHQAMRVEQRERRGDVAQVAARFAVRQRRELLQVLPVEQLHRVVRPLLGEAVVVDLDDARVLEPHQRVVLALEQRLERAALGTRPRWSAAA